jgi:hypothetical protein
LKKLSHDYKERMEMRGATPQQIQAGIQAGVEWAENHVEEFFDTKQLASSPLEDMGETIREMQELESHGQKGFKKWDALQSRLNTYFARRYGGK